MYRSGSTDTQSHLASWFFRVMLVIGFACLFIISTTVMASTTYASGRPGGNVTDPVVRAVDIAEPAVVLIITKLGAHLTVHFSQGNVTFPQGTGNSYPVQLSGSGTFITAHGDILTADHVINPPHDPALNQFLDDLAAKDVAAYMNLNAKSGSQVSANQVDQELKSGQIAASATYDPATSEVFLNTTYTGPLTATDLANLPFQLHAAVDRIEKESSFNQRDVAIVHVNMNDMASVQLGDSGTVQQQDQLTIIGFPGNGDVSNLPTDLLTASVNTITVSSIKTTDTGAQVIQVGGNVEHGDSGGPALDNNGTVVGIVSFGLSNSGGTTFLQASNSAEQLVQSLNLDTKSGPFQQAWSQAFTDYAATTPGHWHKAAQEFTSITTKYPLFKEVKPYLTYTQEQAKTEQLPSTHTPTSTPSSQNPLLAYMWTIGAVVVLLALALLMLAVVVRRRGKKSPTQRKAAGQEARKAVPPSVAQPNASVASIPAQRWQAPLPTHEDGMVAFGAPASSSSAQPSSTQASAVSGILRPWPCGHMNRPNARFCSICGEPAPQTTRQFEQ